MNSHSLRSLFVIVALALAALSCAMPFNLPFLDNSSTGSLPAGITLGETYRNESGGFSISKVSGYDFKDEFDIVRMTTSDTKEETGPEITVIGGINPTATSNQQVLDELKKSSGAPKLSDEKEISVSGVKGISANLAATLGGVPVKGRIVVAVFSPTQEFVMLGIAPEERWTKETGIVFDKVLQTVSLFKATEATLAATTAPTSTTQASPTALKPTLVPSVTTPTLTTQPSPTALKPSLTPSVTTPAKPQLIRQWAKSAVASSQYGNVDWSAMQAAGEPDSLECGDQITAWASAKSNTVEWLELTYETPVTPTEIIIYQTYNPSQVTEVMIITTSGEKFLVHSGDPEQIDFCPDEFSITLELNEPLLVNKVRLTVDQRVMGDWNEIDAVELVGMTVPGAQPIAKATAVPTQPNTPAPTSATQKTPTKGAPAAGTFSYQVKGAGEDSNITSGSLQYQSTSAEIVIGLNSADLRYSVSLFLPKTVAPGEIKLLPYNKTAATKGPSVAVFIGAWFYYGQGGTLQIDKLENGAISGNFSFTAVHQEDATKIVSVTGTFSKIPLSK